MDRIELRAEPRSVVGKQVRALRRSGTVPANVYGHGGSTAVQMAVKEAERVLSRAGRTQLIDLAMDGGAPTTVLVKDYQRHPTRGSLLHVDFYRVAMNETLKIDVPVQLIGEAPGVREYDASVFQSMTSVGAESLPADLPEAIEVDLSILTDLESAVHVRDLRVPSGVTITADPDELVVKLMPPTVEEEPEDAAVADAGGEAAADTAQTGEGDDQA